ncbi:MAG: glycine betaine ABC transporter substrate-binding protein [Anaerolineae bacterium]|jgi:osmoprotectant transport system substrate-binding protein|nr:hypothetical protein [Chloroflexota bacterium]
MSTRHASDGKGTRSVALRGPLGLILVALWLTSLLLGCTPRDPQKSTPIVVGAYPDSEQQMLAALTAALLRDAGYTIVERTDLASEWHVRQALESGRVQLVWQNSPSVWFNYLHHDQPAPSEESLLRELRAEDRRHDIVWLSPVSWSVRQSVLMRADRAEQLGVNSIGELAQQIGSVNPRINVCAPEEVLQSAGGVAGMQRVYGFRFTTGNLQSMSHEAALEGLLDGSCDTAIGSRRDLALHQQELVLLRDDRVFFSAAILAPGVHIGTYNQYPELERIMGGLTAALDSETLARLEREAVSRQGYDRTARRFLQNAGLIE